MERWLKKPILEDLKSKIVLLSGPRQVEKTTLSKSLSLNFDYLNYENIVQLWANEFAPTKK